MKGPFSSEGGPFIGSGVGRWRGGKPWSPGASGWSSCVGGPGRGERALTREMRLGAMGEREQDGAS